MTWTSTVLKKTWRGATKPAPMMETRVFPSLLPEEGSSAVIVGVPEPAVPKAKQLGTVSVTGDPEFVRKVNVIVTGTDGDTASGKAGVVRLIVVGVTEVTSASRVTPAAVKVALVVAALPGNRPPVIVRAVPPVFGPK